MIITFFAVMLSEQTRDWVSQSKSGTILARLIQRTQTLLPEDVSTLIETNLDGFRRQIELGKDKTEGVLSQADKATIALDLLQETVSIIAKPFAGNSDPANESPSLPTYDTPPRPPYQMPLPGSSSTSQRPAIQENESASASTATGIQFSTSTTYDDLTIPSSSSSTTSTFSADYTNPSVSTSVVAPSADLQPMTSTTTPPQPAGTDWQTLFREMK